jgi:hypothetical protein
MPNSSDGNSNHLPDELAAALRRATDLTLNAFHSLRIAVRDHVHEERSRGATLQEIDADLCSMIVVAGGNGDHSDHSQERITELTTQVLKWSGTFYSRRDGQ